MNIEGMSVLQVKAVIQKYEHGMNALGESLINFLSMFDTPIGRRVWQGDSFVVEAIREAKETLTQLELDGLLTSEFVSLYSMHWR